MPNRLASEQSPYLLQHKDNPVDWYAWGDAAFEKARAEDKPIFLSVGYSTCHWCHVMEHESFEDPIVASVLNRSFVSIKVDREERPDVDRVYMTFVQATTGSGGWPMSVWLTPDLEPFYGGTYFPPTNRWGRPGFTEILEELARVWRDERHKVLQSASSIVERLRALGGSGGPGAIPDVKVLETAVREFAMAFDGRRGGFGNAPKFPRPSELLFLLREHQRTLRQAQGKPDECLEMVLTTLRAMALGGMRDHVGGGFHRYSVDGDWRVPHFEKMLYDQAQLVLAYLEAAQVSGDSFFADVAADTLAYVRRDLTEPGGAFYSAEDADSVPPELSTTNHQRPSDKPHKSEGAFYIWRDDEIGQALGEDAECVRLRYGILPAGNAPFDPQNEFTGKNLLYTARTIEEIASLTGREADSVRAALERGRAALLVIRSTRPRPHLDDKVLTAWNGLMIAAYARAARILPGGDAYLQDATRAASFVRAHLWNVSSQTLLRRYRQGVAGVDAYAEDYAYLMFGLLELFQAGGDPAWLEWALTLQQRMDDLFWDAEGGGWFSTTGQDPSVLLRLKEEYDGAEPAASSVAVLNLMTLAHLTGDPAAAEKVTRTLAMFGASPSMRGRAVPMMLAALSTYYAKVPQIVIAGEPGAPDTRAFFDVLRRHYLPTAIVVPLSPARQAELARVLSWTTGLSGASLHGSPGRPQGSAPQAIAYVCHDFACELPAASTADFEGRLNQL